MKKNKRSSSVVQEKPFLVRLRKDFKKNYFAYLLLLPVLIWYFVFHYMPMYGIVIAFQDYKPLLGISGSKWVGLKNVIDFLTGDQIFRLIKNTLMQNLWALALGFPAPIILALLLNEVRINGFKRMVQTITYMPHFLSIVIVCGLVIDFTDSNGFITTLVNTITGTKHGGLLNYPSMYRPIYALSGVWQTFGWSSIIYLSSLASIDPGLYEAAEIDGAGRFRKMWNITLPCILPTIMILLIRQVGGMMASGYEKTILLYNPVTYEVADTIGSYVYRRGIVQGGFSYSTAASLFSTIINFTLLLFTNWVSKKTTEISLF